MKIPFVDLKAQYLTIKTEIDNAISDVLNTTSFIGGNKVQIFESLFSDYLGGAKVISCANGTDSIEILLRCFGVGRGDEVIVPAVSWISTSEAVGSVGATPIFVDIDETGLININKIEVAITKKTKCIIPVHIYGQAVNMDKIMMIAKKHNVYVLEDCAQAHGALSNNLMVGTIGDCSSFSFYPGKNLGAYGDAGCMVAKDLELAEQARMIANHGQKKKHDHYFEGRNSRLDGLQAAVLSVKIKYIKQWTEKRIEKAKLYKKHLTGLKQITLPSIKSDGSHVYHLFVIQSDNRNELADFLNNKGIETAIHYPAPLPLLKAYSDRGFKTSDFPIATNFTQTILSLPIYPELEEIQIEYIANSIKEFYV